MSYETRRKVIFLVVAVIVVALVLGSVGCSSTTGSGDDDGDALDSALYAQAMSDVCVATTERLDALPTPPEEIGRADWSVEVSRALRDEAAEFDEIEVGNDRRADHDSFVANTESQATQWLALSEALGASEPHSETIGAITSEITELTLGRNDLAEEMKLSGCQARQLS